MPDKRDRPLLEVRKLLADLQHGHPVPLAKIDLVQFRGRHYRKTAITEDNCSGFISPFQIAAPHLEKRNIHQLPALILGLLPAIGT